MNIDRKHTFKIPVIAVAGTVLIAIVGYLFWLKPLEFERTYLANAENRNSPALRQLADARAFYLGASSDDTSVILSANFQQTFNSSTPENLLKLSHLLQLPDESQNSHNIRYDFSETDQWLDAAAQTGIRVRGHTLIWGRLSDDYKAPDLQPWLDTFLSEQEKKQKLTELVEDHITTVLERYRGRIFQWDVVNEPLELRGEGEFDENVFTRHLGHEYIELALHHAHTVDPSLKLYINEQLHNYTGKKAQAFYTLVSQLLEQGVPLHGVGLQHHMLFHLESAQSTQAYLKRFEALGLEVEITELDARLRLFKNHQDPYQAQGDYYAEIVQACLNVSTCKGVTLWGVNDSYAWHDELGYLFPKPNEPYLFDADNHPKPGVQAIGKVLVNPKY